MTQVIEPGAVIGLLGSGQLGRMFTLAARRMGYRVHTFSPDTDTPTGQVADVEITAEYADLDAVSRFAQAVEAVTFEFENVPADTAAAVARHTPVRPDGSVLHVTQNRLREKIFLSSVGLPVTPFVPVSSLPELELALTMLGTPAVLKTAGWGYDGKGQVKVQRVDQAGSAWHSINGAKAVLEKFVDFRKELSVVAARAQDGSFTHFGVIENEHHNHILHLSAAPADISDVVRKQAIETARTVLEQLQVVGVLCIEFFLTPDDRLLINELAPRPHNSGHLTIDACVTSQFEQQLRAVCGLPLGDTTFLQPAAMINLLGDLWSRPLNWPALAAMGDVKLHLYGKAKPRTGRKMGHLTVLADSPATARQRILDAYALLSGSGQQ